MKYKLSYDNWGNKELKAINKIILSKNLTMGKKVREFEKKFAKYVDRKYAVMTNSGSSANLIGVASQFLKKKNFLKKKDEVIVPAVSWSTTYSPLQQYDLKLKFVDVEIDTFNIDINKLKKAITKKTKMICVVSILGNPANLIEIEKLCKKNNIILYEDNCESLGAEINNRKTGSFGNFSTHSFFYSHHISTIEGGMIVTNDFETYCILKAIRAHGWTRDLPNKNKLIKNNKNYFYEQYKFLYPGYNLRPTEINAAVGIQQIKNINKMINLRINNLRIFEKYFKDDPRFIIQETKHKNSSFCFPIVLKRHSTNLKYKIFRALKKKNIDFRLITGGCFTNHQYKKYFDYSTNDRLPNAKKIHNFGFFVGNASRDLSKEIKYLHETLKEIK